MNGATADPCDSTMRPPKITKNINIGRSQNFFLSPIKRKNSLKKSSILCII